MKKRFVNYKRILIKIILLAMVSMYGNYPIVNQAQAVDSIKNAKDTLSSSLVNKYNVRHQFDFATGSSTPTGGYIDITFPVAFGDIAVGNITCPGSFSASSTGPTNARCVATAPVASGTKQIVVTNVDNATSTGSYQILMENYEALNGLLRERVIVMVAIVEPVIMTARVDSTLTFVIAGTSTTAVVNGAACDKNTSATSTDFGTLAPGASTTVCQILSVTTNATKGFVVTVEQDQELTSDGGSNINSFNNSPNTTGSTTPEEWTAPRNLLDEYHTYGHMGLTSDDTTLTWGGGNPFGGQKYVGFNNTDEVEVMYHGSPSDGQRWTIGKTGVAYTAEIGALQEAGDYKNTLTYIATPTY